MPSVWRKFPWVWLNIYFVPIPKLSFSPVPLKLRLPPSVSYNDNDERVDNIIFPPSYYSAMMLGDINEDGNINIQDVILSVNIILSSLEYNPKMFCFLGSKKLSNIKNKRNNPSTKKR